MIGTLTSWRTFRAYLQIIRPNPSQSSCRHCSFIVPNGCLVDSSVAPKDFTPQCAVVYPNFLSPEEGDMVVQDLSKRMRRRRYEEGHWDSVITKYKEIELTDESMEDPRITQIFERTRQTLANNHLTYRPFSWLPCHAIDLKKDGELNAHVDSVKFSGDLVAGISLCSHAIMRLAPHVDGGGPLLDGHVDLYLPPLSLYALTGVARYSYSHQLLEDQSTFTSPDGESISVARAHRQSIIFRDAKRE